MMKTFGKAILFLASLALYLNIGWGLGGWHYENVSYGEADTFVESVMAGGWGLASGSDIVIVGENRQSLGRARLGFSVAWPLCLAFILGSWLVFGIYKLGWLIFGGGLFQTLGWSILYPVGAIVVVALGKWMVSRLFRINGHT